MKTRRGFAPILIIVVIALIGGITFIIYLSKAPKKENILTETPPSPMVSPTSLSKADNIPTPVSKKTLSPISTPKPVISLNAACGSGSIPSYPATGPAPLLVHFYKPSPQIDANESKVEGIQWDFDSNSTWDTELIPKESGEYITFTFNNTGVYEAKYRIKSTQGAWAAGTCSYPYKVTVGCNGCWYNDDFIVDTTVINATISRNNPNTSMVTSHMVDPVYGFVNYGNGLIISFKKNLSYQFTRFSPSPSPFVNHGLMEYKGFGYKGDSINVFTFISPPYFANGNHVGAYVLEYQLEGTDTWKKGPIINYNIKLTD